LVWFFLKQPAGTHPLHFRLSSLPQPERDIFVFCFYNKVEAGCRGVADTLPFYIVYIVIHIQP
jgi:hypothetical protein